MYLHISRRMYIFSKVLFILEEDLAQKHNFAEHSWSICKFFILSLFINNRYFACCSAKFHETHSTRLSSCIFALELHGVVQRVQKKRSCSGRKLEQLLKAVCISYMYLHVHTYVYAYVYSVSI